MSVSERPAHGGPQSLFYATAITEGMPRMVRGEGIYFWDDDGTRYIDVASGTFLTNLGQGNERVLRAMYDQGKQLTFSYVRNTRHDANEALTERVARLAGPGFERVHLSSGGSEANEMAMKFLRQYAVATGQPQRTKVITLMPSFHGATFGAIAMNGDLDAPALFGPFATFSEKVPAPLTYRSESPEAAARITARPWRRRSRGSAARTCWRSSASPSAASRAAPTCPTRCSSPRCGGSARARHPRHLRRDHVGGAQRQVPRRALPARRACPTWS